MNTNADSIKKYVGEKIYAIVKRPEASVNVATLARLRRGIGKTPGSLPDIWDVTLGGVPGEEHSIDNSPTKEEWAVHVALTLFSLHQQGKKHSVHQAGMKLGKAVGSLAATELKNGAINDERIRKRLNILATSHSIEGLAYHLRGIVQLLKREDISLDYQELAKDLFFFQTDSQKENVILRWGRDYYSVINAKGENDDGEKVICGYTRPSERATELHE